MLENTLTHIARQEQRIWLVRRERGEETQFGWRQVLRLIQYNMVKRLVRLAPQRFSKVAKHFVPSREALAGKSIVNSIEHRPQPLALVGTEAKADEALLSFVGSSFTCRHQETRVPLDGSTVRRGGGHSGPSPHKYRPIVPIARQGRWLFDEAKGFIVKTGSARKGFYTMAQELGLPGDRESGMKLIQRSMADMIRARLVAAGRSEDELSVFVGHRKIHSVSELYAPFNPGYMTNVRTAIEEIADEIEAGCQLAFAPQKHRTE